MKSLLPWFAAFVLLLPTLVPGEEKQKEILSLEATDTPGITQAIGQQAKVTGNVMECFWVRDRVLMIIFQEDRNGFVAVSFAKHREALDKALDGDAVTALKGKNIAVTGEITTYNERPQMVISTADQITFL